MCTPLPGSEDWRATLWTREEPLELHTLLDDGSYQIGGIAGVTRDGHVVVGAAPPGRPSRAVVLMRVAAP
jgi:hypothetical protein